MSNGNDHIGLTSDPLVIEVTTNPPPKPSDHIGLTSDPLIVSINEAPAPKTTPWDRSVMKLNTNQWVVRKNIRRNIMRHLPQLQTHPENPQHIAIVGGGWSLEDTYEELRELYFNGVKLVALNGAGRWLMERNLRPSMQIVLDARPDNAEFLKDPIPHCKYMLASQCDPSLFDLCEDRDTMVFHVVSTTAEIERKRLNHHYLGRWTEVPCSGTVGMVAIMLCRMLGFRFQHLFGIDSCYRMADGRHHAYEQKINNDEGAALFVCGGREFMCSAWQASQVQEFLDVMKVWGEHVELSIHGDGVLAHVLKTAADSFEETREVM